MSRGSNQVVMLTPDTPGGHALRTAIEALSREAGGDAAVVVCTLLDAAAGAAQSPGSPADHGDTVMCSGCFLAEAERAFGRAEAVYTAAHRPAHNQTNPEERKKDGN